LVHCRGQTACMGCAWSLHLDHPSQPIHNDRMHLISSDSPNKDIHNVCNCEVNDRDNDRSNLRIKYPTIKCPIKYPTIKCPTSRPHTTQDGGRINVSLFLPFHLPLSIHWQTCLTQQHQRDLHPLFRGDLVQKDCNVVKVVSNERVPYFQRA